MGHGERERDIGTESETWRDRVRHGERDTERHGGKERQRDRERQKETQKTESQSEAWRDTNRVRQSEGKRHRDT